MSDDQRNLDKRNIGFLILGIVAFYIIVCLIQGCASIKYGMDREYVKTLKAPYMVGTQINGMKLMQDKGSFPAMFDAGPSFLADLGLLPYHLGLYWIHDVPPGVESE
jgi:hypothetical protein